MIILLTLLSLCATECYEPIGNPRDTVLACPRMTAPYFPNRKKSIAEIQAIIDAEAEKFWDNAECVIASRLDRQQICIWGDTGGGWVAWSERDSTGVHLVSKFCKDGVVQ